MNGVQFWRSLKQQQRTQQIPVIAMTGSASESEVEAAKNAGCVSVLTEPCSPEALLAEIRRVLALPQPRAASWTASAVGSLPS